jgi:hypothetical protein
MKRQQKSFQLLVLRWVIDKTFAWLIKKTSLVGDFDLFANSLLE